MPLRSSRAHETKPGGPAFVSRMRGIRESCSRVRKEQDNETVIYCAGRRCTDTCADANCRKFGITVASDRRQQHNPARAGPRPRRRPRRRWLWPGRTANRRRWRLRRRWPRHWWTRLRRGRPGHRRRTPRRRTSLRWRIPRRWSQVRRTPAYGTGTTARHRPALRTRTGSRIWRRAGLSRASWWTRLGPAAVRSPLGPEKVCRTSPSRDLAARLCLGRRVDRSGALLCRVRVVAAPGHLHRFTVLVAALLQVRGYQLFLVSPIPKLA